MKKILAFALLLGALALPLTARAAGNEGCIVAANASCEYVATTSGSIIGAGAWSVEVWWAGVCGVGSANWVRSSANGDNNLVDDVAGTWEGSVAAGSCVRATTADGVLIVGNVIV